MKYELYDIYETEVFDCGELGKRFAEAMGAALSARPDEARKIVEKYGT